MNWRTLGIILILANLIYWAWQAWIAQPEIVGLEDHRISDVPLLELVVPDTPDPLAVQEPPLVLENAIEVQSGALIDPERPVTVDLDAGTIDASTLNASTTGVDTSEDSAAPLPVALVCRRIGPFVSEQEAVEAATWFETEGIRTQRKAGKGMVWQGYWVYLPKYPNREAAVQVVLALREKGMQDLFVEINEPHTNAVSLGLFRKRTGAETRLRQIRAQGYAARIGNKEREQGVFWLEAEVEAGREIPMAQLAVPSGQVRRVELKDCL